jgi:hypothetical protein
MYMHPCLVQDNLLTTYWRRWARKEEYIGRSGEPWRNVGRPRDDAGGVPELARVGDLAGSRLPQMARSGP